MARVTPRAHVNGKAVPRKTVSHEKPPEEDDETEDDNQDVAVSNGDDVPAGRPPVDSLSEMLASLQGATSSRITVYRVVKNQPQSYVFECDPASFSLDDLRDKYNGGEFRLYVSKDGRLFKNMRVVVEPKQMPHGDHMAPGSTGMADVLAVMRDGFSAQAAALREAMAAARPAPSPFSMMDVPAIITAIAGAVTALRPAAPPVAPAESTSKAIDMFMQGLQLARELREDAPAGDNSIGGMLRDVLKSPIVAAAVQSAVQQTPQQPRLPNPHPNAPIPQPAVSHAKPSEPQPTPQPEKQVLAYYLGFLVGKAKAGADASLYAELVLDNVPDAQLTPMLQRGDALIDDLIAIHPPVAEHREWFVTLLNEVNELLAPDDEVDEQAGDSHAINTASAVIPGKSAA